MRDDAWPLIAADRERLLRIARRRCASREDAEDVVSEAMLRCAAFEGLDETRIEQFLTTVTIRLCSDLHRRSARRTRALVRLAADGDVAPGPEDEVCGGVDVALLSRSLDALPARQRAVIADRARGLSVTQIAARHALSYKAAESALARARGALRAALASALAAAAVFRAVLRPRRAAVVALPAVTLVLLTTAVLRLPVLGRDDGSSERAVVVVADLPERTARPRARALDTRRAERAVARPAAPAAPAAQAPAPAGGGKPPGKEIVIGDDPGLAQTKVKYQPREGWTPTAHVEDCVRGGPWVEVEWAPDGLPSNVKQGCG